MDRLSSNSFFFSFDQPPYLYPQQTQEPLFTTELEQQPSIVQTPKTKSQKKTSKKVDTVFKVTKGKWSTEEDLQIKACISINTNDGEINWNEVVKQFCEWAKQNNLDGRSKKQCLEHYENTLAEGIRRDPFDNAEKALLKAKYPYYPNKWAELRQFFPDRSTNSIKNCAYGLFKKGEINRIRPRETTQLENSIPRKKNLKIFTGEIELFTLEDLKRDVFVITPDQKGENICEDFLSELSDLDICLENPTSSFIESFLLPTPTDDQFFDYLFEIEHKRNHTGEPLSPLSAFLKETFNFSPLPSHENMQNLLVPEFINKSVLDNMVSDKEN